MENKTTIVTHLTQAKKNAKALEQIPSTLRRAPLILLIHDVSQQHILEVRGQFSVPLFHTSSQSLQSWTYEMVLRTWTKISEISMFKKFFYLITSPSSSKRGFINWTLWLGRFFQGPSTPLNVNVSVLYDESSSKSDVGN